MKNRMLEIGTSGTVRGEDGNILTYSATKSRDVGHPTLQQLLWGIRRVDTDRERGEEVFRWAIEM